MLALKLALSLGLLGLAQAQVHARPPYFPEGCDGELPGGTEVRDLEPLSFSKDLTIYRCVKLGEACTTSGDCTRPNARECHVPDNKGKALPLSGSCIDGYCRFRTPETGAKCDCLMGCALKSRDFRDLSCLNGRCVAAECAPCGEAPNNRACCAPGVVGHDGKCFCATGAGEGCSTNPNRCDAGLFNDMCCPRGTDNEGKCCASGSCNGRCLHQPK